MITNITEFKKINESNKLDFDKLSFLTIDRLLHQDPKVAGEHFKRYFGPIEEYDKNENGISFKIKYNDVIMPQTTIMKVIYDVVDDAVVKTIKTESHISVTIKKQ